MAKFAAAAPLPPAPSAYIAQAQQRYQDATARNINIVEGPSTGSDRRLIRQGSVDKFRAVYEANSDSGGQGNNYQSLDRRARKQTSNDLDNYRSLDRSKQQQQNRVLGYQSIYPIIFRTQMLRNSP